MWFDLCVGMWSWTQFNIQTPICGCGFVVGPEVCCLMVYRLKPVQPLYPALPCPFGLALRPIAPRARAKKVHRGEKSCCDFPGLLYCEAQERFNDKLRWRSRADRAPFPPASAGSIKRLARSACCVGRRPLPGARAKIRRDIASPALGGLHAASPRCAMLPLYITYA